MNSRSKLFNAARLLCLLTCFISLSLLVSCKFDAAIKLFLVHLNLGSYWIQPIRKKQSCADENILVELDYSNLLTELPPRLHNTTKNLCPANSPFLLHEDESPKRIYPPSPIQSKPLFVRGSAFNSSIVSPRKISEFDSDSGYNKPIGCIARQRTAVIIPYRNREDQLKLLLAHLNPILQRQQIDYQIFVIDQQGTTTFSRARLMNAGFLFVRENYNFDCFIFHDVDLLLETEEGLYKCSNKFPRHLSSSIDKYHYTVPWLGITGGVMAFTQSQYEAVNGFSNEYWGWGCEDDDMFVRIVDSCLHLEQADKRYYKYKMIVHQYEKSYKGDSELDDYFRFKMASSANLRKSQDGISNLGLDYYKMKINSTNSNRTIVSANIGVPDEDLKSSFLKRFVLSQEEFPSTGELTGTETKSETSCIATTPILFLLVVQCAIYVIITSLYKYWVKEWGAHKTVKKNTSYELLENEEDDQSHDSISIQSLDMSRVHKRTPSNGLDSISVQTK